MLEGVRVDIAILQGLLNEFGFPVVVCLALLWSNRESVKHHERVLFEFKKTIDNNTASMQKLFNIINRG